MSDFDNIVEINGQFEKFELDDGVDFFATGDAGAIIIEGFGWGEDPGGWGDGPWGGQDETIIISSPTTIWTNIDTP